MITQVADITVTALIWALVAYRAKIAWQYKADRRVTNTWFFVLFFALCMTFHVDGIYVGVGRLTGIGNFSWLLAYAAWVVAAYFSVQWSYNLRKHDAPRWIDFYLLTSLSVLCVVFFFGVASSTVDTANHVEAGTNAQLLFMGILYFYSLSICILPARNFFYLWGHEKSPVAQFRMGILFFSIISAILVFAIRAIFVITRYFQIPIPAIIHNLSMIVLLVGGIAFVIFFVPGRFIFRPIVFVNKIRKLWYLTVLQRQINRVISPIIPREIALYKYLQNLDQNLFITVKAILDGKFLLSQCVQYFNEKFEYINPSHNNTRSIEVDLSQWNRDRIQHATKLVKLLEPIHDDKEYSRLMDGYAELGKAIQKETLALWISRIFHPFILPVPVMFFAIYLAGFPWIDAAIWTSLFIVIVIVPSTLFILWNVRTGRFSDRDVSDAKERRQLYIMGLVCVVVYMALCYFFYALWIVLAMMWGLLLSQVVAASINRFVTKISIHTIGAVGSATILFWIAPVWGLVVGLIALALSWSRTYLGHHSRQQVLLGWIVAITCTTFVFQLF